MLYLHNTFHQPIRREAPSEGKVTLELHAYGAFTVGAVIEQDGTPLELDLAALESAPPRFRER